MKNEDKKTMSKTKENAKTKTAETVKDTKAKVQETKTKADTSKVSKPINSKKTK